MTECLRSEPITSLDNEEDVVAFEVVVETLKECFRCQDMSCLIKKEIVKLIQQQIEVKEEEGKFFHME